MKGEKERTRAEIIVIWSASWRREESSLFRLTRRKKSASDFTFDAFLRADTFQKQALEINLNAKDAICNVENIHLGICILKDKRPRAAFSPSSGRAACHYDYNAHERRGG
jgi:hypothetical protein